MRRCFTLSAAAVRVRKKVRQLIRVAAYCRVSTDQKNQANSFEAQQRYFREYIESRLDWILHEIYADEGITGTSRKKVWVLFLNDGIYTIDAVSATFPIGPLLWETTISVPRMPML